jgi:PAS domain S-box-containing protein
LAKNDIYAFKREEFGFVHTIVFQGKPAGIVYIRSDLGAMYDRLRSYTIILLVILGASLVAALTLSRILQRVVSQPILRLAETVRHVSRDKDYSVRAQASGDRDEVALLVDAFNGMLVEIHKRDLALQESEQQFRTLADSIPQLAWMAEPDGSLFWYNHRWYQYTGTSAEEMAGWGWQSVHDPETPQDVLRKWRASLASGKPFEMIFPLRGADGTFRQFLTLAMPVRDAQGNVVRWFGTNTDITEQRRSEQALRQTEKLAATGRLAASIAHEINNPLEAVTNLVYLARRQPTNVEKYLKLADQELDRIAQITKNTLGFYRDSTSPAEVDISTILEEVLSLYARKIHFKRITLRPDYGNGLKVMGYPGEIRQIFANLIANAIEALSEEGFLAIRASKVHRLNGDGPPGVRVTFLDNGSGIAPAHRKKIFEPFYTTKKDVGTGLGLWLTQNLVTKHHGSLHVRSCVQPGRTWTAFSVFLPERPPKK